MGYLNGLLEGWEVPNCFRPRSFELRQAKIHSGLFCLINDLINICALNEGSYMGITIIEYESKYAADFKRLNLEWLDGYGLTEADDLKMLDNPEKEILDTGGCIYLAKDGEEIVGSCALIQEQPGEYELAKMGINSAWRGRGISRMLIDKCMQAAKDKGAKRLFLISSSQLQLAISLYEKYGFRHMTEFKSHYANGDVMMEKWLE